MKQNKNVKDIKSLPLWAQSEINRLNKNVESLENKLRAISEKSSNVYYMIRYPDDPVFLPPDSRIIFDLGEGAKITVNIKEIAVGKNVLYVNGSLGLMIVPEATNAINIICDWAE